MIPELYFTLKGIIIGFLISAPIGPVSILCIRRTLSSGWAQGAATGLGAALGDLFYAIIAAFGLTFVINFLKREDVLLRLIGGFFLLLMAAYVFFKRTKLNDNLRKAEEANHVGQALGSAFLVDISNPLIVLFYIAIFSGFGLAASQQHLFSAISLVVGVGIGAFCWWILMVQLVCLFRRHITETKIKRVSQVAAFLLAIFGLVVIISTFYPIPFLKGYF